MPSKLTDEILFLNNSIILATLLVFCGFLYIPAFFYGVASLWAIVYLFVFVHLGRALCQLSLRQYEARIGCYNEFPKIKWIVHVLCAYLSLPFLAYFFIVGDLDSDVSSGLDRAVIMALPLKVINLPIDGYIYFLKYIFILPSLFLMPYVVYLYFFAIVFSCIDCSRSS